MKVWSRKWVLITAVTAATAMLVAGCGNDNQAVSGNMNSESSEKIKVVTSFYPMYEFSKQVGGEHADVMALVPAGAEPHDWEPSAKDMAKIKEADVFVYNGIVEGWAEQSLESAPNDKRIVVEASSGINLMEGVEEHEHAGEGQEEEEHESEEHVLDPHVWLSPVLAQQEVRAIQEAFEKADPEHKEAYKKNADTFIEKLKTLDDSYKTELQDMKRNEFITQHAAFGYLAKEYGLIQVPIAGLSPDQEPSPEQMAEVIKFAKVHDVKTIFFETLVDPKIAQTIADEISAQTGVLNPIEGLTEDEMKENVDYITVMERNLKGLKKALSE